MRRLVLPVLLALVVTGAALPPAVSAHTLSVAKAKAKAKALMKAYYREFRAAGATDYSVGPCLRRNSHRVECDVSLTVKDEYCTDEVAVYFRSRTSRSIKMKVPGRDITFCGL